MRLALLIFLSVSLAAPAQTPSRAQISTLSSSFQELSRLVAPSVVKVSCVGYRQLEEDESDERGVAARQQSSGSGVIIDPEGYVLTNAHVVIGALKVQVRLVAPAPSAKVPGRPSGRIVRAEVVGLDLETDVALLKVAEKNLPALKLADSDEVEQGQIVLAFGSPMGLDNTVTMGVVSSPARQLKPDDPMIYIQTDAPINPGNSGGPLVNTSGEIVGINTLILSQSGGSEGIGFAVPSNVARSVVEQLRKAGRVVRGEIGVTAQTITPALAAGWKLPQSSGVVLGDVEPSSTAQEAGLQVGDIVLALNGKPVETARQFNINIYRPAIGDTVTLEIARGQKRLSFKVKIEEKREDPASYADLGSREENLVPELGIFAVDLSKKLRDQFAPLRRDTGGILVASRDADGPLMDEGFKAGDVLYSLNHTRIATVADLRALLKKMKPGDPVAIQIERDGKLRFIAFELP